MVKKNKKNLTHLQLNSIKKEDDQNDTEDNGSGGGESEIRFHYQDPLSSSLREDSLSPDEQTRLRKKHLLIHKERVEKQKIKIEDRGIIKNQGKKALERHKRKGYGAALGKSSSFEPHPKISKKPQFSGSMDPQVTSLPSENIAETNEENRHELENRYQHKLGFQPTKKFNPKPTPY